MALTPGTRLGPYEITAQIGAGGMGEVYRATDTNLSREVAIKMLPPAVSSDAERVARFDREARTVASLNHPNIAAVYGLERTPGGAALVMELVEGPTLADRAARGPIPVNEALGIARQIAEAIDAAHQAGVIHRDLKPANVKLRPDGAVKVLDFGLAKPLARDEAVSEELPTALPTQVGTALGTPGYMSPEQTRGQEVDRRTDVWAFGCVLFEMLTGVAPFRAGTPSDTAVRVLEHEPDWTMLPSATPDNARRVLRRCLEKDPRRRLRDMGDVGLDLGEPATLPEDSRVPYQSAARRARPAVLVVAGLALAAVFGWVALRPEPAPPGVLQNATYIPFTNFDGDEFDAALSQDGRFVAFLAQGETGHDVWLGQVDTGRLSNLTEGRLGDVVAPLEVRSVGFTTGGAEVWLGGGPGRRMRTLPLTPGPPRNVFGEKVVNADWTADGARVVYQTLDPGDPVYVADGNGANPELVLDSPAGHHQHHPIWSADEEWIYLTRGRPAIGEMALWRMRASGDGLEQLTTDKLDVRYPTPLDANTLLYVAREQDGAGPWLWAYDLQRRTSTRVATGVQQYTSVSASADGRLIAATVASPEARLWSVPILDRVATEADVQPYPVPSARALAPRFGGNTLFYLSSRGAGDGLWRLDGSEPAVVWSRPGSALLAPAAISLDATRVAVVPRREGRLGIEILSADGAEPLAQLDEVNVQGTPSWSPDGQWILTGGADGNGEGLFRLRADGAGSEAILRGEALNPVWAPGLDLIAYLGAQVEASAPLLAVRSDGTSIEWPPIRIDRGGRFRFLPDGSGLVYTEGGATAQDFFLLDLRTLQPRRLTALEPGATMNSFDISPDGARIVFDRQRQNSNIVLIERDGSIAGR